MSMTAGRTADKDSNIVWFVAQCTANGVPLEACVRSAERAGDRDLAEFFRHAQRQSSQVRHA